MRQLFKQHQYHNLIWLWLAAVIVVLDQVTKYYIMQHLPVRSPIAIMPFFNLYFNYNPGAAFSLLAKDSGWQLWFFSILAILVSGGIIHWLYRAPKPNEKLLKISLMLILGGAVGNLIDRLIFGQVRDFLDFYWRAYHWPTFNVADSAICIGALLLAWYFFCHDDSKTIKIKL